MHDVVVIGGGPAGLAASVYLARQKLDFVILTKDIGGLTLWSSDVENYLGFHLIDGVDLVKQFRKHLEDYKDAFEIREGESVSAVAKIEGGFRVTTDKGPYEAKAVLVVTGERPRELSVPGEKEFYGKGVTYCANCDAPLYGGKNVTVIGGGNSAMDAALFLAKYASHVTIITVNKELMGDAVMKKKCETTDTMTVIVNTKTTGIMGNASVTGLEVEGTDGKKTIVPSQGIFIEIGLMPSSQFIDIVEKNKWGEIVVDKHNATSVPGIWAAGDVTDVTEKQISVAVGEGSKAALRIIKWFTAQPK